MSRPAVLVVGAGHLSYRIRKLAAERGHPVTHLGGDAFVSRHADESTFDIIARALGDLDLRRFAMVFLVDDRDELNLELLIALLSLSRELSIVAALFNEHVAPHLQAVHPNVRILNPAKMAAPAFIQALDVPLEHTLRYVPARLRAEPPLERPDPLMRSLLGGFLALVAAVTTWFHVVDHLSWLDATYFVIVTVATVGYGDISLLHSSAASKLVGIALILSSTCFIWMIFSLTVDRIIRQRVQLALGRKRYSLRDHVILCGLGRLGYFIAEGLLDAGEKVVIVQLNEDSTTIGYLRSRGAHVYIGDARLPRVLQDVGVMRAKALYSVVNNDYANLEIGLNARSFAPDLRLILRIFDESMAHRLKAHLDIHLTLSMTAIADEQFLNAAATPAGA